MKTATKKIIGIIIIGLLCINCIGQSKVDKIKSLKSFGYSNYSKMSYVVAFDYYEKALHIAVESNNKKEEYNINSVIGDIYFEQNKFEESAKYYLASIKIAKEIGSDSLLIEPMNFMAAGFYSQTRYGEAYKYYIEALNICEKLNDKVNAAIELLNIGSIHYSQNNYDKALEYYNMALRYNEEAGQNEESAKCLNNIGMIYEDENDTDRAIECYVKGYDIKIKGSDYYGIINSITNIGNIYTSKKEYGQAIKYYLEGLSLSEKYNNKDRMAMLMINIGIVYKKSGAYQDALLYLKNGISIAKKLNLVDCLKFGYEELASINSLIGDYKSAYENHILFSVAKDTIFSENKSKNLLEIQTKYETENKEKEIQLQKEKISNQAFVRNTFIFSCIVLLLIVFLLFNRYRIKQKANLSLTSALVELEERNKTINEQSAEINQNISYAQRIQQTLLPDMNDIKEGFNNSFIMYKPKAVVSGDFYWYSKSEDGFIISAIDCTGHGVSGAFMSVMAHNILFQIDKNQSISSPSLILQNLHENIRASLKQDKSQNSRDGMDVAMCKFSKDMKYVDYSGAMRPMYHVRDGILVEYKSDKCCIGGYQSEEVRTFSEQRISLQEGDCVYLFSDGYADQFGGEQGKKFMNKRLKDLLSSISQKSMDEQNMIIEKAFEDWRGSKEQIDDVLVIGIKI